MIAFVHILITRSISCNGRAWDNGWLDNERWTLRSCNWLWLLLLLFCKVKEWIIGRLRIQILHKRIWVCLNKRIVRFIISNWSSEEWIRSRVWRSFILKRILSSVCRCIRSYWKFYWLWWCYWINICNFWFFYFIQVNRLSLKLKTNNLLRLIFLFALIRRSTYSFTLKWT